MSKLWKYYQQRYEVLYPMWFFIGTKDLQYMNGYEIKFIGDNWYTNGLMDVLGDMLSYLGTSFYETSLKAAFGDETSLEALQKKKND